jgi:CRP/FNR family transcriptional regulator
MKDVTSRLSGYLLKISRGGQSVRFNLPTSKTEIARELGTINETLSRALRKLRESGVIEVHGKEIEILQADRLTGLAEGKKID